MAENQKVFVSPGVYTAEKDLTFVAQSVGVTTLGVVGEATKGPAFEPIFVSSFDEFRTRFGKTSPEKYQDSQIPKYELSFIARSYLEQSNQLFVTRVLGLSGYDAGPSWTLTTIGGLDPANVGTASTASTTTAWEESALWIPLTGGSINTSNIYQDLDNTTPTPTFSSPLSSATALGNLLYAVGYDLTGKTLTDGTGTSLGTFADEVSAFVNANINDTAAFSVTGTNKFWYWGYLYTGDTSLQMPNITGTSGLAVALDNRFGIDADLSPGFDGFGYSRPDAVTTGDFSGDTNDGWYQSFFEYTGGTNISTCLDSGYSGLSIGMFVHSATTATTYVEGVTNTGFSGSSDDSIVIVPDLIGTDSQTYVQSIGGFTACTTASSWNEWSFVSGATGNNIPGQTGITSYFSYSAGTSVFGINDTLFTPNSYPFVGSNGTGSTLSAAIVTFSAETDGGVANHFSGGVTDYQLITCAGGDTGLGTSEAYTAVQTTLSGFSSIGLIDEGSLANQLTQAGFNGASSSVGFASKGGSGITAGTIPSTSWFFTGNSLSSFTTFYTGSCSAVTYLGLYLSGTSESIGATDGGGVDPYSEYHNMTIATLRSRGQSTLSTGGPEYVISADTTDGNSAMAGGVSMDCTGTYSDIINDPMGIFGLSAKTDLGVVSTFKVSLDPSKQTYLPRVLGQKVFDREAEDIPVFVEEIYPNIATYLYRRQKIRGLQCCVCYLPAARFNNTNRNSIGWYMNEWETPKTPWVVSELKGTSVDRLFRFVSVSDGTAANREYKISIINISWERREFDLLVRDFYDTDASPTVLEKYTRCSLDPSLVSFIGRKIGTTDGEYELKSTYTMLELSEDVQNGDLKDSLPCGFEGYRQRTYCGSVKIPVAQWKTKYYTPGETIYDPYYDGSGNLTNASISAGDNIRRNYLGFSDGEGAAIDYDFFEFKGYKTPTAVCSDVTGTEWPDLGKGFHMDSGATTVIAGSGNYLTLTSTTLSGESMFLVGDASFQKEPTSSSDPYYKLQSRKYSLVPAGGFDGWDEYRKTRSNTDQYRLGLTGFLNGACADSEFTDGAGKGTFKKTGTDKSNTDYYAYRTAIDTYQNPEAVDINLFATPGIDYVNNLGLVNHSVEMVESDRADSLYISTTPDYNMFVSNSTNANDKVSPTEAVNNLEDSFIDSNYTATYYPWVQVRDNNTNRQLYIPPTGEVVRNMALTDNIAFPWFASAGYTRGIVNAIKARTKLTLDDRDTLYVGRINPIATFSDVGPIIFGNKTLQIRESALDRINVRRLLLQTRKLISAVAVRLLFEQNDDVVRQQFLDLVNPILDSIRRDRGLTDFRVVLSNDPEEIDRNEMNGKIYIKPTRALEFIFIEFLITPTGASFEDV
jgi:hypothetical protein